MKVQNSPNRIDEAFRKKNFLLLPFIEIGIPNLHSTSKIILSLEKAGAGGIEVGIPFSDPIADGPVIQQASQYALKNGINIYDVFKVAKKVRKYSQIPLLVFSYINLIYNMGIKKFVEKCKESQIDGVIIPDYSWEDHLGIRTLLEKSNIYLISFISPTTPLDRMKKIAIKSKGFIYLISVKGTTGARKTLPSELPALIKKIKEITSTPVVVGFGISSNIHIKRIKNIANGAIVGSALIERILTGKNPLETASNFIKELLK